MLWSHVGMCSTRVCSGVPQDQVHLHLVFCQALLKKPWLMTALLKSSTLVHDRPVTWSMLTSVSWKGALKFYWIMIEHKTSWVSTLLRCSMSRLYKICVRRLYRISRTHNSTTSLDTPKRLMICLLAAHWVLTETLSGYLVSSCLYSTIVGLQQSFVWCCFCLTAMTTSYRK